MQRVGEGWLYRCPRLTTMTQESVRRQVVLPDADVDPDGYSSSVPRSGIELLSPSLHRRRERTLLSLGASGEAEALDLTEHLATSAAESLSDRELQVLRLLDSDLTGPQIARELFVTHNTVRTHTQHIFTKLDVTNRRAAVLRARERGLI